MNRNLGFFNSVILIFLAMGIPTSRANDFGSFIKMPPITSTITPNSTITPPQPINPPGAAPVVPARDEARDPRCDQLTEQQRQQTSGCY